MTQTPAAPVPTVLVTGANGLVGAHVCAALVARGATVRALVRRPGSAPDLEGVEERVGELLDPDVAATAVAGTSAVVSTVHPMGADLATQRRIGVEGTTALARAAADAGVHRFVHVSTAAVYDRSPGVGDVDEESPLVGDDGGDYPVTKRDTDAALAGVGGLTRVLLRPPAIAGPGPSSVWNTLRPAAVAEHEDQRRAVPGRSWAWVHVEDLATLAADVATGAVPTADQADGADGGPVAGGCTAVNVAGEPATWRDYLGTVAGALGVDPVWQDGPAWTGQVRADRARAWGWEPRFTLTDALAEIAEGLRAGR